MIRGLARPLRVTLIVAAVVGTAPARAQQEAQPPAADTAVDAAQGAGAQDLDLSLLPPTLLFSFEEMRMIESAIASGPLARGGSSESADPTRYRFAVNLYLSSIVWSGPESWTVWINGVAYGPDRPPQGYDILDVGPDAVLLSVPWGEGGAREIRLATRQTFVPQFGGVIEGRLR